MLASLTRERETNTMKNEIRVLAHRGGMGRAPENTLAAFRQAFADGADAFECDVRLTRDNEPVIIHTGFDDDDIQPVTGSTIPFRQLSWAALREQKVLGSDEPVAHLDEALAFVQETGLPAFIEPKESSENLIPTVIDHVRRFDVADMVGLLTFYRRRALLVQAKRTEPAIKTSAILINPTANFLKAAQSINADGVIIGWSQRFNHFRVYNVFFRSLIGKVERLRANGITVEGGFVRTQEDVRWLLRNGINGLWTNDVAKIRECVNEESA